MSNFEKLRCAFGDAPYAAGRKDFVLQRKIWFTVRFKFSLPENLMKRYRGVASGVVCFSLQAECTSPSERREHFPMDVGSISLRA